MNFSKYLKWWDITESILMLLKRLNSFAVQDPSFSTSATLCDHPLLLVVKRPFRERELCDILWVCICIWRIRTTHFYHLALFNLVLGLSSNFIEIQEFKWWMAYMVTWPYMVSHHPRGTTNQYIDQSYYQYKLFIYPFQSLTGI